MNIKKKLQRFLTGILTLCMVMSMAYIPMQVRAENENLELGWSGATVLSGVFTGADGTATLTIGGTQYGGNSSSVVIDSLDTEIVVALTANEEGKKGVLRTGGESGLSFSDDAAVTVGKVTTYTFTLRSLGVADLATFVALNVAFEDNNPGGGNTEAPTDAISVELWDNFGNLLDYGQYSSTEVPEGMPVIGAKIQYSYDGNAWNELANSSDTNLFYDGSRYVFHASVATVYLKVISVERGFLASAALEGIDDGYTVWEGPVENGKVYTLNEQKAYDLKYDDGNKTITWSDDSDRYGVDGVVQNGTVKIISAVDSEGNSVLNDSEPFMQNEHEGYISVKAGATVTVQIKPNYGYQFISGSLNGNVVTAGSEVSIFTFTMPKTNLHLSALFTESEDKVIAEAKDVTGAEIVGGARVIDSGNLEITVTDSAISDADKNKLQSSDAASGVEVKSWLEVDLAQIVNKGSSTEVWRKDLEELTDKIAVTLQVGTDLDTSKQYVVVREHQGVYEKIPAIYDATAGTLTFESDKFSNYAVGTVEPKQNVQDVLDSGQSSTSSKETVSVPIEYIVVKGDTLGKIARRNHMSLSALLALNPQIKNPNLIRPGQKIVVGFTGKIVASQTPAANPNAEYYVVQRGDCLYKIARKNKLSLAQLAALNPEIMSQRYIYAGQKIRVK